MLFLRAEAHYLGGGARFARVAIPILLTVASRLAGEATANATGASYYTYNIYGPGGPTGDTVFAQTFLVHAQTRELLWFGQAIASAHYEDPGTIDQVAKRLAEQVPSKVLKGD